MAFITTTAASISSGGTINGDLTVTGDFKVEGAGSFAFDEIIQGSMQVTGSNTFIDVTTGYKVFISDKFVKVFILFFFDSDMASLSTSKP